MLAMVAVAIAVVIMAMSFAVPAYASDDAGVDVLNDYQTSVSDVADDDAFVAVEDGGVSEAEVSTADDLLEAIKNAEAGVETTITLESDVTLDSTLVISGGKDITLEGGTVSFDLNGSYSFYGDGNVTVYVEEGSSLTLGDGFTLDGNTDGSSHAFSALYSNGSVTLDGGKISNYYQSGRGNRSVILSEGDNASFTILDGSISNNSTGYNPGSILEVSMGASLAMSGGTISNNAAPTESDCDAIVLVGISQYVSLGADTNEDEGGTFEFTGGTIRDNTATSTVYVGESNAALGPIWSQYEVTFTGLATMAMSGDATISDNTAGRFGGGVAVWGPGSFTMNGGTITGNSAGESGGGVAAVDMYVSGAMSVNRQEREGVTIDEWSEYRPAAFTMNGGTISNNTAGSTGGGVYVASNNVLLTAGTISGNSAGGDDDPGQGGGIYVASTPYVLELDDALVTDNTASLLGGGVWICPSGSVASSISKGGAVIDNSSDGAGDDVVSLTKDREGISTGSTLSLLNRMLGGYLVSWYEDGTLMSSDEDGWSLLGYPASDSVRYADMDESERVELEGADLIACDEDIALKAVTATGAIEAAQSVAKLVVTGNTAARGAGIGSNGCVQFGDDPITAYPSTTVTVQKVWDDNDDVAGIRPDSVTVSLYENGVKIDEQALSDENEWTYTWSYLPQYEDYASEDEGAALNEYEVVEDTVKGYTAATATSKDDETGALNVIITNTYKVEDVTIGGESGKVGIQATKVLSGRDWRLGDSFEFILVALDNAPMPVEAEDGSIAKTVSYGDASKTVDFGAITYDEAGTYTYTLSEVQGSLSGVTYDETVYTVTVNVTDNGQGQLGASVSYAIGEEPAISATFTNTYSGKPSVPSQPTDPEKPVEPTDPTEPTDPNPNDPDGGAWVTITKTLAGRDLVGGEFQFVLSGIDGTNSEGMSSTGTNTADGSVDLGEGVVFSEEGTYRFTISEVFGSLGGVDYDGSVYYAVATVTDNGDGTLSVDWQVTDAQGNSIDQIVFENTYAAAQTSVTLGATKVLDGRELAEGEFTFQLVGADGTVVSTATNAADGSVTFGELTFTKAGVYEYSIVEVAGSLEGVTYDTTVHYVTVTVTDDGEGQLHATVEYADGAEPVFTNTYAETVVPSEPTEPSEPAKPTTPTKPSGSTGTKIPETGDTSMVLPTALGLAGVVVIGCAVALRRRMAKR